MHIYSPSQNEDILCNFFYLAVTIKIVEAVAEDQLLSDLLMVAVNEFFGIFFFQELPFTNQKYNFFLFIPSYLSKNAKAPYLGLETGSYRINCSCLEKSAFP